MLTIDKKEQLRKYIIYLEALRQVTTSAIEDGKLDVIDIENMLIKHIQEGKKLLERYKQLDNVN